MARRQEEWPHAMTTLTTHDTKRSEDTRARISVLAELPDEWAAALRALQDVAPVPDQAFASLLWQAVLGAWPTSPDPDLRERLHAYAEKAMREAGDRTTWVDPDEGYEAAVHQAVDAVFDDDRAAAVVRRMHERVTGPGRSNGLAAKLLSLTVPGVPDVYQGTECWDQSLVDPDNRRPVDYDHRVALLAGAEHGDDWVKTGVVLAALTLRRQRPDLFTSYTPVTAVGGSAGHVVAFDRGGVVAVATRLPVGLAARGWGDTVLDLPPGAWSDVLTGRDTDGHLGGLLADHPVALLVRDGA
jgi:(1->4)-alpha-D-glucan 1-alpha-D-glucosylmutase